MIVNWKRAAEWAQEPTGAPPSDLILFTLRKGGKKIKPSNGPAIRFPKGKRPPSLGGLKRKAWDAFSKFIRQRDADETGHAKCCTCPEIRHWKGMDAGHFKSRMYENTLFDEKNVHAQCKGCNMKPNNGRPIEYAAFLEAKYGIGTVAAINARAYRRKMERSELLEIIEKYSGRVPEPADRREAEQSPRNTQVTHQEQTKGTPA